MSNKQNRKKPSLASIRSRYTWHLQSPFENDFDHSHWWKEPPDSEIKPVAALYELARRHPLVGEMRSKFRHARWYGQELHVPLVGAAKQKMASHAFDDLGSDPRAIHCLCLIGLKSWAKLDPRNKDYWEMSAGKMKGVDCRDDIERCNSITSSAHAHTLIAGRTDKGAKNIAAVNPRAFERAMRRLAEHLRKNPISSAEMEEAIAREAVSAYREGHFLISIAPDLKSDDAKILLERAYREDQNRFPPIKQRLSFFRNWLDLISEFEEAEVRLNKVNSQLFARYRRVVDGIRFSDEREVGHL